MAGIDENVLTCSICMDFFKDPKQLPCQHSFCKDCLDKIIIGDRKRLFGKLHGFHCPLCRRKIPLERKNGKTIVFQTNYLLSTLLECNKGESNKRFTLPAVMAEKQTQTETDNTFNELLHRTVGTQTEKPTNLMKDLQNNAKEMYIKCLGGINYAGKMFLKFLLPKVRNTRSCLISGLLLLVLIFKVPKDILCLLLAFFSQCLFGLLHVLRCILKAHLLLISQIVTNSESHLKRRGCQDRRRRRRRNRVIYYRKVPIANYFPVYY